MGLVLGEGVMLDVAVEVDGITVHVEGKTTLVPVETGLFVGGGKNVSSAAQPDNGIMIRVIKIQRIVPDRMKKRSGFRIRTFLFKSIIHPNSAAKSVFRY